MTIDSDQQDELLVLRPCHERLHDSALQQVADDEEGQAAMGIAATIGSSLNRPNNTNAAYIHGEHGELAVREIDDAHHAEDDRQAERHQPVHEAGQHALDQDFGVEERDMSFDASGPSPPLTR